MVFAWHCRLYPGRLDKGAIVKIAIDIADAIVAELKAAVFNEPLIISRRVLPEFELAELKALTVTVVPKSVQIANITRQSSSFDVAVDIGVQQKIDKDTDAEVERLSGIVTELVSYLNRKQLAAFPAAQFKSIVNEPVYVPEYLSQKRLFMSILTLNYKVISG